VLLFVFLLVLIPIIELYVIVEVAGSLGAIETVFLLFAMALGGAWLVKREGLGVARRVRQQLDRGELPAAEVVDGLLILLAGVLMVTPGFVTGAVGLLVLIPFVRRPLGRLALGRLATRADRYTSTTRRFGSGFAVYDVTEVRSADRSGHGPERPRPLGLPSDHRAT
jgi:UPF0716 protein FxsA